MMWKRFTVSILCLVSVVASYACGYFEEPGGDCTYMFKTYNIISVHWWDDEQMEANVNFWYNYVNGKVSKSEINEALYKSDADDIDNGTNGFFRYLLANDDEALCYWILNKKLFAKMGDSWYYPKKSDKDEVSSLLSEVERLSKDCTSALLKERFVYLYMRTTFYLRDYDRCQSAWNNCKLQWQDTDMRKKCYLYYAGTLFYTGETNKAADIYAENGDWQSLRYFKGDVEYMQNLYADNPKSKAFLYFVQNYINKTQDKGALADKKDFMKLCEKAISEKKTDNPALWQSALAQLTFLGGDLQEAIELIEKAMKMDGDEIVKDNVRMLRLMYHAADITATDYDKKIGDDFLWLLGRVNDMECFGASNSQGFDHSLNMLSRIIFKYMFPYYVKSGNHNMAAAVLNAYDEAYCYDKESRNKNRKDMTVAGSGEYSTYYFNYLDTTSVENVKDFLAFVKSGGNTQFEKLLIAAGYVGESMMNELIATKYMRLHDYGSAITYFEKVMPFLWKKQNITEYLERNPFMEAWIGAEEEKGSIYSKFKPTSMYALSPTKMQFCSIMKKIESKLQESADDDERAELNYAYAVGLVQSETWCWALTQYAKSIGWNSSMFQNIESLDGLQNNDNGWDYKSSKSYVMQCRYKKVYACLDNAEKLTKNAELAARCRYMRAAIELDVTYVAGCYRNLMSHYAETKFIGNESHHCDILADYR